MGVETCFSHSGQSKTVLEGNLEADTENQKRAAGGEGN